MSEKWREGVSEGGREKVEEIETGKKGKRQTAWQAGSQFVSFRIF